MALSVNTSVAQHRHFGSTARQHALLHHILQGAISQELLSLTNFCCGGGRLPVAMCSRGQQHLTPGMLEMPAAQIDSHISLQGSSWGNCHKTSWRQGAGTFEFGIEFCRRWQPCALMFYC